MPMPNEQPVFKLIDYRDPEDSKLLVEALDQYAKDPMGGAKGLSNFAKQNLAQSLAELPHAFSILMLVEDKIAGLANCFEGFFHICLSETSKHS